jgi:hypothetical protein
MAADDEANKNIIQEVSLLVSLNANITQTLTSINCYLNIGVSIRYCEHYINLISMLSSL